MAESSPKMELPSALSIDTECGLHIWYFPLHTQDHAIVKLHGLLNLEEQEKAERFSSKLLKCRFIVGRASLRLILGRYLNEEPAELAFENGEFGKPSLRRKSDLNSLQFNMAHSHDLGTIAVANGRRVGIDIERVRTIEDMDKIVLNSFSPFERSAFAGIPAKDRTTAFLRCWTRKEAYLKATGMGLSLPLDKFDVTMAPGHEPRLLRVENNSEEVSRWSFSDLDFESDYIGTVAVEGRCSPVKLLAFDPECTP